MVDERLGSELGRLFLHQELTSAQVAAGFRLGRIYQTFERLKGKRSSPASPSYGGGGDHSIAEELMSPEALRDLEDSMARRVRSMFVFTVFSPFRLQVSQHLDHATFPVPASSNAGCGFPALRSPVCFTSLTVGLAAETIRQSRKIDSPVLERRRPYCRQTDRKSHPNI
jgi:hypothetical protein